ncbi:hypothetical protein HSBAA_04800 [Vreelandella sulfidaeris]|uniref:GGDEF domain-containing protein n=1 Tax=Vreelandella sulfidaeris TaxID=115553 RepID=A0A455U6M3_9GAMM|nr:hypothetical protein HSBAA_04800 [Halomonas sulfidaeris]
MRDDEWAASYSAVLVIDLDNFRLVNDIQGHNSGDQLLINVAEQLRQRLGEEATLARFSSDEFVVLVNNLGEQQTDAVLKAERVARQLLETIAQLRSGHSLPISASIGISLFTGGEHSMDSVLQQADMALQQAKRAGGNTLCFFNTDMQTSVLERASLEADLHKALERNELALHYQVQVDHQGVTTGVEALLRWYHPARLGFPRDVYSFGGGEPTDFADRLLGAAISLRAISEVVASNGLCALKYFRQCEFSAVSAAGVRA